MICGKLMALEEPTSSLQSHLTLEELADLFFRKLDSEETQAVQDLPPAEVTKQD